LAAQAPDGAAAFHLRAEALLKLKRGPELRKLAEERLRAQPNDREATRALITLAAADADPSERLRLMRGLIEAGRAEAEDVERCARADLRGPMDRVAPLFSRRWIACALLALAGAARGAPPAPEVTLFADDVWRRGVFEGQFPVSADEQAHREVSYRFTRRGGK